MPQDFAKQFSQIVAKFDEHQLHIAHGIIAQRLSLVHKARALYAMSAFQVLDRVSFTHHATYYHGTVMKLNQKTITVRLDNGQQWNVSPSLLAKVEGDTLPAAS